MATAAVTSSSQCLDATSIEKGTFVVGTYSRLLQRALDVALVIASSPIWVPMCVAIAALVSFSSTGPILYRQRRRGRDGASFDILKFRTMREDADAILSDLLDADPKLKQQWERGRKLDDDPRVTSIGRVLRQTSLDELPQLINVLKGDMSLVGPRPLPDYHLEGAPDAFIAARHSVTPGVTGFWQIAGRDGQLSSLMSHDGAYLQRRSLMVDIVVIAQTLGVMLSGHGGR